jgi:hypothetical protein
MHLFRSEHEQCTTNTIYNASANIQNSPVVRSLDISPGVGGERAHSQRAGEEGVHSQRLSFSPRLPPPPTTTPSTVPALLHGQQYGVRALGGGEESSGLTGVPDKSSFSPESAFAEPDHESKLMVSMEEEFGEELMLEMLQNTPQVLRLPFLSFSFSFSLFLCFSRLVAPESLVHLSELLCYTKVYLSSSFCSCVWWNHRMYGVFARYSNLSLSLTHTPPYPRRSKKASSGGGGRRRKNCMRSSLLSTLYLPRPVPSHLVCVYVCVRVRACACVCVF